MSRNQIRVVTIFWGNLDGFLTFVRSLFAASVDAELLIGITPEWNGWADTISGALTSEELQRVRFVQIPNLGFGANMNELARTASKNLLPNDYIIVANNDGLVQVSAEIRQQWNLLSGTATSDLIISRPPKKYDQKRYLQIRGSQRAIGLSEDFFGVSVRLLNQRGGILYDERYFMYWEDADLELSLGASRVSSESIHLGFEHRGLESLGRNNPTLAYHYHRGLRTFVVGHWKELRLSSVIQASYMILFATIRFLRRGTFGSVYAMCRAVLGLSATARTIQAAADTSKRPLVSSTDFGSKEKITLLIHTRNEASRIERCISSALQAVDEIIVVDMESTDETCSLSQAMGAKVYSIPCTGTADSARAFGLSLVATEWVLALDADEVVPPQLCVTLLQAVKSRQYDAVNIPFRTFMFGKEIKGSGWQNDSHTRLYRPEVASYSAEVHEFFHLQPGTEILELARTPENSILHFNYRTISEFVEKMNRYTDSEAEKFNQAPTHRSIVYKAVRGFLAGFFHHKGYRDGEQGIVLALLMVMYRLLAGYKARARFTETSANDAADSAVAVSEIRRITISTARAA
jgi:glycosyltransferase involved in cell wall biosynthesis/GT2 family glycosyltransferase